MPSPRKVEISASARRDLRGIWRYALEMWDEEQADAYSSDLEMRLRSLAEYPERGHEVPKRPGVRRVRMREHLIYYRATTATVTVLRVVHARMDSSRIWLDE